MNSIAINGNGTIFVDNYPEARFLNSKLHQMILNDKNRIRIAGGATRSEWNWGFGVEECKPLLAWISSTFKSTLINMKTFDIDRLIIYECWNVLYDNGQGVQTHNHLPFAYTFLYYVSTPEGSAPTVFTDSGKEIKAEVGKCAFFPSFLSHRVSSNNKGDKRSVLVGNFGYERPSKDIRDQAGGGGFYFNSQPFYEIANDVTGEHIGQYIKTDKVKIGTKERGIKII